MTLQEAVDGLGTALMAFEWTSDVPAVVRLRLLSEMDELAQGLRELLADERAGIIASRARVTTTRGAALELELSPSAVGKAVARVRALEAS